MFNKWIHVTVEVNGSNWKQTVSYNNKSVTQSYTMPTSDMTGQIGLDVMWGADARYVKNILISPL